MRQSLLAVWAALSIVMLGCSGADTYPIPQVEDSQQMFDEKDGWATEYTVLVDPSFNEIDQSDATLALNAWSYAVPVHFTTWNGACQNSQEGQICIHNGVADYPDGGGPGFGPNILGWTEYWHDHADVYIYCLETSPYGNPACASTGGPIQFETLLHELGHALGCVHHVGPYIMNPYLSAPGGITTLTADDANQYYSLRGLPTIPEDAGQ